MWHGSCLPKLLRATWIVVIQIANDGLFSQKDNNRGLGSQCRWGRGQVLIKATSSLVYTDPDETPIHFVRSSIFPWIHSSLLQHQGWLVEFYPFLVTSPCSRHKKRRFISCTSETSPCRLIFWTPGLQRSSPVFFISFLSSLLSSSSHLS